MRVCICLGLCMAALWLAAAPVWAVPPDPTGDLQPLTVSSQRLRAGESVTVSGDGCAPGNQVRLDVFNPDRLEPATIPANSAGGFEQVVEIPASSKVGRAWIRATCLSPDAEQRVMQATVLLSRPEFVITPINVIFGLGTSIFVLGLGLLVLRKPGEPAPVPAPRRRRSKARGRPPKDPYVEPY